MRAFLKSHMHKIASVALPRETFVLENSRVFFYLSIENLRKMGRPAKKNGVRRNFTLQKEALQEDPLYLLINELD